MTPRQAAALAFGHFALLAIALLVLCLSGCDMPEGARRCEMQCSARGGGYRFQPSNGCAIQSCTCTSSADGGR